ncbi:Hypothetical predicted protein [Lecanosticta acicola]|uniref:Uncharacterized protein n=1 Tax=Lecanosticta acicola TaxID=111012 RepID=A0AAI8YRT5_9PEZI|nr:Hypothetical predicted protein [Lecanosticta acicola]
MKFASTLLLAAAAVLAGAHEEEPTVPHNMTAGFVMEPYLEHGNHLELRQDKDLNSAATQAATQQPAVTTFYMEASVGATVTYAAFVYTQTFAAVPDQWPSPSSGSIGLGTLVKQGNGKRDAHPTPAPGQPLVLVEPTEQVTQWLQPVTRVTEMVEIPTSAAPETPPTPSPSPEEGDGPADITTTFLWMSTGSARVFPGQMNPEYHRPTPRAARR